MTKGKTGVSLTFYAVFAFLLALIGQTTLCGLILGIAILIEKDEWLTKQVIQAFGLLICRAGVSEILDNINLVSSVPILGDIVSNIFEFISSIISLVVLLLILIAISKVIKGKDADIPVFSAFANWAVGKTEV